MWCVLYLFRRFCFDELLEDFPRLRAHLIGRRYLLEVLTRQPEFDVLVAELRFQKGAECGQAIWREANAGACQNTWRKCKPAPL